MPVDVGTPEISPVEEFIDRPAGILLLADHVIGDVPEAEIVAL